AVASDPRMLMGSLSLHRPEPNMINLPDALLPLRDRIFGADLFRKRSNAYARTFPLFGYQELNLRPMLAMAVSGFSPDLNTATEVKINYRAPEQFRKIKAESLIRNAQLLDELRGKVVVLGYTIYRD